MDFTGSVETIQIENKLPVFQGNFSPEQWKLTNYAKIMKCLSSNKNKAFYQFC